MGIFGRKKPFSGHEGQFFDILSRQSAKTVEGLEALWNFAENTTKENANMVRNIEREADELRRILIEGWIARSSPLDRKTSMPVRAIDDVVDYANTRSMKWKFRRQRDEHIKIWSTFSEGSQGIERCCQDLKGLSKISSEHAVKAKSYENQMEKAYHVALAALFFKGTDHCLQCSEMREIYRHLSNAADRGDRSRQHHLKYSDETHINLMTCVS
jgi:uncharacterized protein Yka (UPF0111/DUF47 family)